MVRTTLATSYSDAETKLPPPRFTSMWDTLYDEILLLRPIDEKPAQYVTPYDTGRYVQWKEVAIRTARDIVREFPEYESRVRQLMDSVNGLKDVKLSE